MPITVNAAQMTASTYWEQQASRGTSTYATTNNNKTITFLTTHDFELCDVDNIKNYHVKEYYEGEKIYFDYKIREGKCKSTNAKYLMKKFNI